MGSFICWHLQALITRNRRLVTNTFFHWIGEELPEFAFTVKRLEMYADKGENASPRFVTLESLGEEIE